MVFSASTTIGNMGLTYMMQTILSVVMSDEKEEVDYGNQNLTMIGIVFTSLFLVMEKKNPTCNRLTRCNRCCLPTFQRGVLVLDDPTTQYAVSWQRQTNRTVINLEESGHGAVMEESGNETIEEVITNQPVGTLQRATDGNDISES